MITLSQGNWPKIQIHCIRAYDYVIRLHTMLYSVTLRCKMVILFIWLLWSFDWIILMGVANFFTFLFVSSICSAVSVFQLSTCCWFEYLKYLHLYLIKYSRWFYKMKTACFLVLSAEMFVMIMCVGINKPHLNRLSKLLQCVQTQLLCKVFWYYSHVFKHTFYVEPRAFFC